MNIINAICHLIENPIIDLKEYQSGNNRANNMGIALEEYIKDLFAGVPKNTPIDVRNKLIESAFSYLGNQNNPPDAILKNGDAIEIKKIESQNSSLALNSSYPKQKLYRDNPMINESCRKCENWTEKDIIYAVGVVDKKTEKLAALSFIYGTEYCASKDIYERIRNIIKDGVESIPNIEFTQSRELGHVNRVDPLGITYLRVRGMWGIENPFVVFQDYFVREENRFNFMCIINEKKFNSFENASYLEELSYKSDTNLKIKNISIKNPDNPAKTIPAKLISFTYRGNK